jgi:TrbC/VIRB2 pilin
MKKIKGLAALSKDVVTATKVCLMTNKHVQKMMLLTFALSVLMIDPAYAQSSLKAAAVSIFDTIYNLIAVVGGISILLTGLNFMFSWVKRDDPKKDLLMALAGTALCFGVVGLIQFMKTTFSGGTIGSV